MLFTDKGHLLSPLVCDFTPNIASRSAPFCDTISGSNLVIFPHNISPFVEY